MPATPPPDPTRRWTAAEVRAELLDETRPSPRYELVDGELLVTPSPRLEHQRAIRLLGRALEDYLEREELGELFASPADLELEPGTIVQPDLFVIPAAMSAREWSDVRALLLVVEVLSPSSARHDRLSKRRLFQRAGVPECWVVDTDVRVVERSRPGDDRVELLDERLTWHPAGAAEPFVLELEPFFARVHGQPGA